MEFESKVFFSISNFCLNREISEKFFPVQKKFPIFSSEKISFDVGAHVVILN